MRYAVLAAVACLMTVGLSTADEVQAAIRKQTEIPAQDLAAALRQLAVAHNVQLVYRSELVSNRQTSGAVGELTLEETLTKLLAGTGITFEYLEDDAVTLVPVAATSSALAPGGTWNRPATERHRSSPRFRVAQADRAIDRQQDSGARSDSSVGAQTSSAGGPAAPPASVSEVVVSGSRVARRGFEAPTPTTVLDSTDLSRMGSPDVADTLNRLPVLRPTLTPSSTTNQSSVSGGNFLDLRGLGAQRTLVLVDGRRFVSSVIEGPTDISVIPQAVIGGVDIVTGGASAAYGSDAVAGVVNIRLVRDLEGFKGSLQGGITDHNDHRNYRASLAWGSPFSDGRGHILLAGESAHNSGIESNYDRAWSREGRGTVANPAYTATNDEPLNLLVRNARRANTSYGGVINSGPLRGIQFAPDGSPIPFTYGSLATTRTMIGGDGADPNSTGLLEAATRPKSAYARVTYELSSAFNLFAEGSYVDAWARTLSSTREDTSIVVRDDNPFLHESIRQAMALNNITSFTLGRYNRDYGTGIYRMRNRTTRSVVGAEGEIGAGWSYDAYFTHGRSHNLRLGENIRNNVNYALAVDAILDPLRGTPVCRDVAARAAGCIPLNVFGDGAPSSQSLDYVTGDTSSRLMELIQDVGALTVRGEPFGTWAGPVSVALGTEYRKEQATVTADELTANFSFATGNSVPWDGSVKVKEVFAEGVIPLVKDKLFAQSLELNLAGRVTDYSTSGTVNTWKGGATWALNDIFHFRGTVSRDIRAPSLKELFSGAFVTRTTIVDPVLNQTYTALDSELGNPDTKPEIADTRTIGVVLSNPLPGLRASIDYYNIKIDSAIGTLTTGTIVDRCFRDSQPEICGLISRDPVSNMVIQVNTPALNLQTVNLSGIDFEVDYRTRVFGGSLALRGMVNYVDTIEYDDGEVKVTLDGSLETPFLFGTNGSPHYRGVLSADYENSGASLYVAARYIGSANFNNRLTSKDLNVRRTPSVVYLDASTTYDLTAGTQLFLSIQNMLDRDPPITNGGGGATRSVYDVIGRVYTTGVRVSF